MTLHESGRSGQGHILAQNQPICASPAISAPGSISRQIRQGTIDLLQRAAPATTGHPRSHAAPMGASAGENSLARIWHSYLILRLSPPPWQRQARTGCSRILAGQCVSCCWRQAGFCVAGPGFQPGKTVVGDFTDPCRYRPDLGEHQRNPPFWHAFDMTTGTPRSPRSGFVHRTHAAGLTPSTPSTSP
jgi:hypothetical protein